MSKKNPSILVERARTHNLKGIDCRVPHQAVTVVTGPSGAGKSSLAFDTIFAEGQRRFVESMSTYARQFLDQMERPPVDAIHNVLPAVALEAKNAVRNARSTVGTITETLDVMRLLFTHLGEVGCPKGHGPARSYSPEEAAAELVSGAAGDQLPDCRPSAAAQEGCGRGSRRIDPPGLPAPAQKDEVVRMEPGDPGSKWPAKLDPLPLVLGRFSAKPESGARILDTLEQGYRMNSGMNGGRVEARGTVGTPL